MRLEFLGDTLESLRRFDPETQRTVAPLADLVLLPLSDVFPTRSILARLRTRVDERFEEGRERRTFLESLDRGLLPEETVELLPLVPGATTAPFEHLQGTALVVLDPEAVRSETLAYLERARDDFARRDRGRALGLVLPPEECLVSEEALARPPRSGPGLPPARPRPRGPRREPGRAPRDAAMPATSVGSPPTSSRRRGGACSSWATPAAPIGSRTSCARKASPWARRTRVEVRVLGLSTGFELPAEGLRVLADGDIFPEEVHLHTRGRRSVARSFLSDFRDLKVGDLVIHEEHGVGRFVGLETLEVGGATREFMVLGYQGGDKLKVPVDAFDRVQKFASQEGARPALDRLGSGSWDKVKKRVKKAMRDMAAELLKLYAERKARPGHAFTGESPWQREFEEAFEYEETADQAQAIADVAPTWRATRPWTA